MSQGSDKQNSSDDLIAELARLMASDAKGEPVSAPAESAPESRAPISVPSDEPDEITEVEATERVDAAQFSPAGERPASEPGFASLLQIDAIDRQSASAVSQPAEPVEFQQPTFAAEQPKAEPAPAPRFTSPASDSFAEPPAPADSPADPFDFDLPPLKPLADTDFSDSTPDHFHSAEPVFHSPESEPTFDPEPVFDNAPQSYDAEEHATSYEPEPEAVQPTEQPEVVDPIAALIAAQLDEADAVQPGMLDSSYSSRSDSSFGRAPSSDFAAHRATQGLPKASRDPLDDIESLIGAALRADKGAAPLPTHSEPVFREPAPQEPTQQPQSAPDDAADTAEAAILAATASMRERGEEANFGAHSDARGDVPPNLRSRNQTSPKPKSAWRRFAGPAVAAALLIAVGLGVYWIFGTNTQVDEDAPVLSADTGPVKQAPDAASNDTPSSVVFSDTTTTEPDTIERLISRDETADAAGNDVSRVIAPEPVDDGGLANRKVRTVTVRPDGTIVSGDTALAGGEQLPVDRPNVPQLPGSTTLETPGISTQTATLSTPTTNVASTTTATGVVAPVPLPRPNRPATTSVTRSTTPGAAITPVLSGSSNTNAVDLIANTASRAVSTPVTQQSSPTVALAAGSSAPAYVQLSSQRTADAAQQSLQRVKSRFAAQLGNNALEVQQVDLGERGIFYRVRMPAQSIEAANAVCSDIKSGGGDCFVRTD